jgi:peptidyl-prolyl cis-trans isomerase C
MRFLNSAVIAVVLSLSLPACQGGGTEKGAKPAAGAAVKQDIGVVLATVDGLEVGSIEFEQSAARKQPTEGDKLTDADKKEVLDRLVDEKLLYLEAVKKGLDQDPKVQKVMVNTLLRQDVYGSVRNSDFKDEDLQKYYEEHKDEFIVPEKVQVKRILIKVSDQRPEAAAEAEAKRIAGELNKAPDSFKDLASKFSEDPYRRRGGDVGFVAQTGKPGLDPAVVEKAFTMKVNEISAPFKSAEGWNIVQVANRRERVERTFQQMKGSVLRKVKNDKLKALYDGYVANLRATAKIEVKADKLAAIEVKPTRKAGAASGLNIEGGPGGEGIDEEMEAPEMPMPGAAEGGPAAPTAPAEPEHK